MTPRTTNDDRRVGIVGTGILGRGIALRLLDGGFEVAVYDPSPAATAGLAERGAHVCASNRELAERADLVGVLVRDDAQCERALCDDDGVLAGLAPGAAVAIHSTVHPDTVVRLAERAAKRDVGLVDAPVAGQGVYSLERGDFWMLGGGDAAVLDRFRAPAATFCERVVHCGPLGSGAVLKLAHNVATYIGYLAIVEADELARAAGVKPGLLSDVTGASGTRSAAMKLLLDVRERRERGDPDAFGDAQMETYVAVLEKDLRVAAEVAGKHGVELPGAAAAARAARLVYGLGD